MERCVEHKIRQNILRRLNIGHLGCTMDEMITVIASWPDVQRQRLIQLKAVSRLLSQCMSPLVPFLDCPA